MARNIIIFVADGLRPGSINPTDTPTLYSIRQNGVDFTNSHSLFPTFTTPNASAIATGHYLGDTGDFSNTVYTGYPVINANGTVTPFIENDPILADINANSNLADPDGSFSKNNFLTEESLLAYARLNGYSTAAIGKLGPVAIFDVTQDTRTGGPTTPNITPKTVILDDSTFISTVANATNPPVNGVGSQSGIPLSPAIANDLNNAGLIGQNIPGTTTVATTIGSIRNNQSAGNFSTAGTLNSNAQQQQFFVDATTKAVLPQFVSDIASNTSKGFAAVYWSRDPDGTQHNNGDAFNAADPGNNSLTIGINGPTPKKGVQDADANLKQIIDYLKATPDPANPGKTLYDNTDIFVTADHGFSTISKQAVGIKSFDANGVPTYINTTSYASTLSYSGVHAGFLPPGFVAIDLAHDLGSTLYDPNKPTAAVTTSNINNIQYTAVDPTKGELTTSGNGVIGGSGKVVNGVIDAGTQVVVAANGGSDLLYVPNNDPALVKQIVSFLSKKDYISGIFTDDKFGDVPGALKLSTIGLEGTAELPTPSIVINFKTFSTNPNNPNDPQAQVEVADTTLQQGQGMHGSFGRGDTFNNMAAIGPDFKSGYVDNAPVSNADVVPTLASILGWTLPSVGTLKGRVASEALVGGPTSVNFTESTLTSTPVNSKSTALNVQSVGNVQYYDVAGFTGGTVGLSPVAFSAVASGDATASDAILWTRTYDPVTKKGDNTRLTAQVSTDHTFGSNLYTYDISARTDGLDHDGTAKVDATGLASGTKYYYRFVTDSGNTSQVGTFKTALAADTKAAVRFGFSGDYDGLMRPYSSTANFGKLNLDFYGNLGDTIYETASSGSPAAADAAVNPSQALIDYHRKYLENLQPVSNGGFAGLQTLYASQGNYTALDNHELGNKQLINGGAPSALAPNSGNGTTDTTLDANKTGTFINQTVGFKTLEQAYTDYQPIKEKIVVAPDDARSNGTQQLYNANQWGQNVVYINTDTRSYRDVRLKTAAGADDTGARADNPERTLLGKTQLAWLKQNLLNAQKNGTVWKFVAISDPIDQLGAIGSGADGGKSWIGGYRAERNELLKFIADNGIKNVVFLSCDDHQNRINELTYLDNINDPTSVKVLPNALSIVDGPIGATGPDSVTDHSFANIKKLSDDLVAKQVAAGVNPIGLSANFAGLKNVVREGDPSADTNRQAADFYSPDTFNYTIFDVSADGKTLNVNVQGINSTATNSFQEPSAANPVRSILSFSLDASIPVLNVTAPTATATETDSTPGVFKVASVNNNSVPLTFDYTISGTATNGVDYTKLTGTATIPAGQSSVNIPVTPIDDALVEGNENVTLTLASGASYNTDASKSTASVTIIDNEPTPVGTSKDDLLVATPGTKFDGQSNIVFTGAGKDEVDLAISPLSSNNRIDLGSGADTIYVSQGDRVFGGAGDDVFDAADGKGNNRMSGGAGNDTFFLGTNDHVLGGDGNDKFFVGSGGGNLLSGGAGADQFWIVDAELPSAPNTILDFQVGTDVIGIQGAVSLGISASNLVLTQIGADTSISGGGQTLAILKGIQSSSLTPTSTNQFVFA
jgi:phosphodiesterase/alkaline phosphatase D-like protein/arylsulfatase A-like enzyme